MSFVVVPPPLAFEINEVIPDAMPTPINMDIRAIATSSTTMVVFFT